MAVVSQSVAAAQAQLTGMRQLDHEQSIPVYMLVPSFRRSAETVIVVAAAAPAPGTPSPASAAVATSKPAYRYGAVEEDRNCPCGAPASREHCARHVGDAS
jgi:hypothetical protein